VKLADKNILVTGGAGFIGSHIVDLLTKVDARSIVVVDNMTRGRRANLAEALTTDTVRLVDGDIRDRSLLSELVAESDIVFHQAALRITQCADEPRSAFETMAQATFDLAEECASAGVQKIVLASSASIYGAAESYPTSELHHPYSNRTLYGALKQFNETLLRSFNDMFGLEYVALRYFNAYGTRMDIHGRYTEVLVRWMERIEKNLPPVIFGDGNQTMDFINVRDIARANILAAESEVSDEFFNIASGQETSLLELANALLRIMGSDLTPEFSPERRINPVPRRLADTGNAEQRLGFQSQVTLDAGLQELVEWWKVEQPDQSKMTQGVG
tara:strand:- start:765 stop:1754 length:990 start_codon:yes stop_codon:yes gene_type:complete